MSTYRLELYEDDRGDARVRRWLREELTLATRQALGYAMHVVLQRLGVAVCGTEFGKQLGGGLFEFRLRSDLRDRVRPSHGTAIRRVRATLRCTGFEVSLAEVGTQCREGDTSRPKSIDGEHR